MNTSLETRASCESVRLLIPDAVAGRGSDDLVVAHVGGCADCRAEMELVEHLWRSRPPAPKELADSTRAALADLMSTGEAGSEADSRVIRRPVATRPHRSGRSSGRPGRRLSVTSWKAAAAIAALALGIGYLGNVLDAGELPSYAFELPDELSIWMAADGMIAGEPAFVSLSEEDIEVIIEELDILLDGEGE